MLTRRLRIVRSFLREQGCNLLQLQSHFDRSLVHQGDVEWLFILTFPNGGSTALAETLLSSPDAISLTRDAEGQWLVPSLCKNGHRWDPDHSVSYRKIRAVWLREVKKRKRGRNTLVIEKSPPNLCRYRPLIKAFETMKIHVVTFSRDPYATCASWHSRYGYDRIAVTWGPGQNIQTEEGYFGFLARIWLTRARMLLEAGSQAVLTTCYEDFADNTASVISAFRSAVPALGNVSADVTVKVKDYPPQQITNMNERQIARLSAKQLQALSSALSEDPETVQQLGYRIR